MGCWEDSRAVRSGGTSEQSEKKKKANASARDVAGKHGGGSLKKKCGKH